MAMYDPPHPKEFIKEDYLEPKGVSPWGGALKFNAFIRKVFHMP